MNVDEYNLVSNRIKLYVSEGAFKGKDIFIFGSCNNTSRVISILNDLGYSVSGVLDNDLKKIGTYCYNVQVQSVVSIKKSPNAICLIYSIYWVEMQKQLETLGMKPTSIYILNQQKEKKFWCLIKDVLKGQLICRRLRKKYDAYPIYICPYNGTGDIYLIGTFWKQYINKYQIEKYIFVVVSKACAKVASMFDIQNIEIMEPCKCSSVIRYNVMCPTQANIKILNDGWYEVTDNSSEWLRGYKGIYFAEVFRQFVFNLPQSSIPHHPIFKNQEEIIEKIFTKLNLKKKKTVIIAPHSKTLQTCSMSIWVGVAKKLKYLGYFVCTNSSGENEKVIEGTIPIYFELDIAPQLIEYAGGFIGCRSGLCDIISGSRAKKIILYDKNEYFYNATAYNYFSLKKMGLSDDVIEIETDYQNEDALIDKIVSAFMDGQYDGGE